MMLDKSLVDLADEALQKFYCSGAEKCNCCNLGMHYVNHETQAKNASRMTLMHGLIVVAAFTFMIVKFAARKCHLGVLKLRGC